MPSLVSVALDVGLRPVEVERSCRSWFHLDEAVMKIPKAQSSKNSDNWECVLSNKSVRALRNWLDERTGYERIIERHGGEIWMESEPGEGTIVYFTLRPPDDITN